MTRTAQQALNTLELALEPQDLCDPVDGASYRVFRLVAHVDGLPLKEGRLATIDGQRLWLALRYDLKESWFMTCSCGVPGCAGFDYPMSTRRKKGVLTLTFPVQYFSFFEACGLAQGHPRAVELRFDGKQVYQQLNKVMAEILQYEKESGKFSGFDVGFYRAPWDSLLQQLERREARHVAGVKSQRFARHVGMAAGACLGGASEQSSAHFQHCPNCAASGSVYYREAPETHEYQGAPVTAISKSYDCRRCKESFLPVENDNWLTHARELAEQAKAA